jgi:hypothetical protein
MRDPCRNVQERRPAEMQDPYTGCRNESALLIECYDTQLWMIHRVRSAMRGQTAAYQWDAKHRLLHSGYFGAYLNGVEIGKCPIEGFLTESRK